MSTREEAPSDLGPVEKGEIKRDQGPTQSYAAPEQRCSTSNLTRAFGNGSAGPEDQFLSEAWKRAMEGRSRVLDNFRVQGQPPGQPSAPSVALPRGYEREFLQRLVAEGALEPEGGLAVWFASRSAAAARR
jgi:hypothetical protein